MDTEDVSILCRILSNRMESNIRWSQEGEYLVSGSDDHRLFIWDAYDKFKIRKILDTGIMSSLIIF